MRNAGKKKKEDAQSPEVIREGGKTKKLSFAVIGLLELSENTSLLNLARCTFSLFFFVVRGEEMGKKKKQKYEQGKNIVGNQPRETISQQKEKRGETKNKS